MFGFAYPGQKYPGQAGPDAVVTAVSTPVLVGPGRLYVEVYSAAGSKLGAGPIFEVLGAQITDRLDQGGDFQITIPASDERAALAAQGREMRIYREGEGLIFRGLIEAQEWQVRE